MRLALLLIALAPLFAACGGPSQAQIDAYIRQQEEAAALEEEEKQEEETGPSAEEVALQIIEECALTDLARLLDLLDVFAPLLDAALPLPPFELVGINEELLVVNWRLDSNGDQVPDMNGTFYFEDLAGNRVLPLEVEEIEQLRAAGSLEELPDLLERLPPGTTMYMQFTQAGSAEVAGFLGLTFDQVELLAGTINVFAVSCTTAFRIRSVTAESLSGAYPHANFPVTISAAAGILVGSVTLDGTPLATLRVTYEGTPLEFTLDLETGTLLQP
jgi:hypothetical protein